jgi:hypothetical protein
LDEEPTITLCELDATTQPAPQDNQLMSKHRVLSLKPQLRLEWRAQNGQNETEQPNHSASLGDSVTSVTRIGFSVHTPATPAPTALTTPEKSRPNTWGKLRLDIQEPADAHLAVGIQRTRHQYDKFNSGTLSYQCASGLFSERPPARA